MPGPGVFVCGIHSVAADEFPHQWKADVRAGNATRMLCEDSDEACLASNAHGRAPNDFKITYDQPPPSEDAYAARYQMSERENPRYDELADDELAESRLDTQSHVAGLPLAHGGLEFRTIEVSGSLLLDSDSHRRLARLGRKQRNHRAILHLSPALMWLNSGRKQTTPNISQTLFYAMRIRR